MTLDPYKVGEAAIGLFRASTQLRHVRPAETIRYLHPESLEGQFVVDLFRLSNDELQAKYGPPPFPAEPTPDKRKELGWGKLRTAPSNERTLRVLPNQAEGVR